MTAERDSEMTLDVATFVAELRRLADALESGDAFSIEVDGEEVSIPEGALFSVAHEREDGLVELEFQLSWNEGDDEEDEDEDEEEDTAEEDQLEDKADTHA